MNSFFDPQFNYCPLVWVLHSSNANTKINNLHFRALKIIHRDETSTFDELLNKDGTKNNSSLNKDGSKTIHHHNNIKLVIEIK